MNGDSHSRRWREATSAEGLTWGLRLDGGPLVAALSRHAALAGADLLEIGPGYGRLLEAMRHAPFASYVGLDLSDHWTRELTARYGDDRIRFVCGDAGDAGSLAPSVDLVASFLTFKHLYPDFSAAARLAARLLRPAGRLIFDLPETGAAWPAREEDIHGSFEGENGAFVRSYRRPEISDMLAAAGLRLSAFDEIEHAAGKTRLLVVAAPAG